MALDPKDLRFFLCSQASFGESEPGRRDAPRDSARDGLRIVDRFAKEEYSEDS